MNELENDFLSVKIKNEGAELCSIFNKNTRLEYLWQAGPAWPKQAPILFPFVGQLKNNVYLFQGHSYSSDRHGFARTKRFEPKITGSTKIRFALTDSEQTFQNYPFHFNLSVVYELSENKLITTYQVENTNSGELFFSIGAHPAFKIPLTETEMYSDYFLEFTQMENAPACCLDNGLLNGKSNVIFTNENKLRLSKALFYNDALVFKNLKSESISIKSIKHPHGLHFSFSGFPYFGIWAAKDADFVCLEPWHGITDNENHNQKIEQKEGIIKLNASEIFSCSFTIETF